MLSLERIYSIIEQTWGRTDIAPLKAAAFARAIEREATAEAGRIMQEWAEASDAREDAERFSEDQVAEIVRRWERFAAAERAIREYLGRMK